MIRKRWYWLVASVMGIVMLSLILVQAAVPAFAQSQQSPATLVAIRAAYHPEATPKYDRVVFELQGQLPQSIRVEYVSRLIADGSGAVVPVKGKAILKIVLSPTNAHTAAGTPTVPGRRGYQLPIVKEIVRGGDFEAVVSYGIGVSRKTEIRFFTLSNPTRVVIDFLHT